LVAIDFFTVPTARLRILFVLVVLAHHRRRVLHFNVTEHPTGTWTAQQLIELRRSPICSAIATASTVTRSATE